MNNEQLISGLQARRATLLQELHHIDEMLKLNGISPDENSPLGASQEMPYKKNDNWQNKLASLIKSTNRFISINEAAVMVNSFEPKISIEDAKKGLGSAKNIMIKDKTIDKYQYGTNNSNTFYGKMGWKNEDGTVKEEHMYNKDALILKPKIEI